MEANVVSVHFTCHGFFMTFTLDGQLLLGAHGAAITRCARAAGWIPGDNRGEFLHGRPTETAIMRAASLSCKAGSWLFCMDTGNHAGSMVPESAKALPKSLFMGTDGTSTSPASVTLVAGDLLLSETGSEERLCGRIIEEWDWWLALRGSTRELAVAWSERPSPDILLLFNMIDAGNLPETFVKPLAAGRVDRLVGWHPVTTIAAEAAGIPSEGATPGNRSLITRRSLLTERFWRALASEVIPES